MKVSAYLALLAVSQANAANDSTITKVVKLLQGMLSKSVAEGDEERKIYAKFKCYCDQSEEEKNANIKALTKTIDVLESQIAEIQGDTGELSSDVAELKAKIADNKAAQADATTLRNKENKAFTAEEADLEQAIDQMRRAIDTLKAVGADQTKSTGADNKQFMAGHKTDLLAVHEQVKSALNAASALMSKPQLEQSAAFLQAPFTGTYTSQSAQVMGIIKSMRDTFIANLADARTTEKNSLEAYNKFMALKKKAQKEMESSYDSKQKELSANDGELASKRKQLSEAQKEKANDEEFLSKLLPMCEEKAKGYANRKMLRANEEAAIAEAISILNSDAAFETFGTTSATSTGATGGGKFLQLRSVHRHVAGKSQDTAKDVLDKAAKDTKSARLSKVAAMLQAKNPFTTVLGEIDKMIALIGEEHDADEKNLNWCNTERDENKASHKQKVKDINSLNGAIDKLTTNIGESGVSGLLKQIEDTEQALTDNNQAQVEETKERTEANLAYQKDVKNLVAAQTILEKALKVLSAYYDDLAKKLAAGEALLQKHKKEDPNAGEAWKGDGAYGGQKDQGGDVIKMLEFILSETQKEETTAHSDEEKDQADYEDSMQSLKNQQAKSEKTLADLQEDLAQAQKDLLARQEDLKATTEDKEAIEAYLKKIKLGCDFITENFDLREKNRGVEQAALEKAVRLIKATPAYQTAVNAATVESYGDCKEPCVKDADHVECKACQADVTIPAYCAGHEGTKGC